MANGIATGSWNFRENAVLPGVAPRKQIPASSVGKLAVVICIHAHRRRVLTLRSPYVKMSDVVLDSKTFFKRAKKIFDAWDSAEEDTEVLKDLKGLAMLMGDTDDEASPYSKVSSLQVRFLRSVVLATDSTPDIPPWLRIPVHPHALHLLASQDHTRLQSIESQDTGTVADNRWNRGGDARESKGRCWCRRSV